LDTTIIIVLVISVIVLIVLMVLFSAIRIVQQYERGVIFVLGRLIGAKGPGLFLVPPFISRMTKVDLRIVTLTVPPQEVITRDNVTIKVTAVVYFYVVDPAAAVVNVVSFLQATTQIGQTTLRNVLGQSELDELLSQRNKINRELQAIIDEQTERWGVKVTAVEIKDVSCLQQCSGPWPSRPKLNAKSAPRLFMPRVSYRLPPNWRKQLRSLVHNPVLYNCATCKRSRKLLLRKTRRSSSRCRLI